MHPLLLSESPADETSSNSNNLSESPAGETSSNSDNLRESSDDETSSNSDNLSESSAESACSQETSPTAAAPTAEKKLENGKTEVNRQQLLPLGNSESFADETSPNSDNLGESPADETSSNPDNLSESADDETSSNSDSLSESSAERQREGGPPPPGWKARKRLDLQACSQETSPTAAPTAEKKLENGKTEVNRLEQEVIHRVSSADKVTLQDIARESVDIICEKMHRLPEEFLNELKNGLRVILEGGNGSQHREEIFTLQKFVQSRTDLTAATLIRAHHVHLEILVAIKTGIEVFLYPSITLSQISLVEIFGYKRCRNIECQKRLPADDCTCEICTRNNGFCNLCMCVICNKFDFEVNTFRWIGCDLCSHWTHTDCAIHEQLISTGPSVKSGAGPSELVFRCQACNMIAELLCWVKDVFQDFAPSWNGETFLRELDYVSKIFHVSKDPRGRELFWKCYDLKEKLRSGKIESMGACGEIMMFLQDRMVDPVSFEDLLAWAGAGLPRRDRSQAQSSTNRRGKRPRVSPEVASEQQAKKPKHHKDVGPSLSPKVRLDDFTRVGYEAYVRNPFSVCMQVAKYGADLLEKREANARGREAETREERDRLQVEKGELQKKLADAEATIEQLSKDRADAIAARQAAERQVKKLEVANSSLNRQLADLQVDLNGIKREKDVACLRVRAVSRKAVEFAKDSYQRGLDQVRCVYPEVVLDSRIFKFKHEVRDGKIVKLHANKTDFDIIAPSSP